MLILGTTRYRYRYLVTLRLTWGLNRVWPLYLYLAAYRIILQHPSDGQILFWNWNPDPQNIHSILECDLYICTWRSSVTASSSLQEARYTLTNLHLVICEVILKFDLNICTWRPLETASKHFSYFFTWN